MFYGPAIINQISQNIPFLLVNYILCCETHEVNLSIFFYTHQIITNLLFLKCVKSSEKPDTSATILAMEPKVLKFPRIWLSDTKVILKIAVTLCYTKDLGTFSRRNT